MIGLTQLGSEITFGTRERNHKLSTKRFEHFDRDKVNAAADDLLSAYPEQAQDIERYRARLLGML